MSVVRRILPLADAGRDEVPHRHPALGGGRWSAGAGCGPGRLDLGELPCGRVVPLVHQLRPRAARPGAVGSRRRADSVLLRGRARAEAGVRRRLAATSRRRVGSGDRGAVRCRRTSPALSRGQRLRVDRAAGRVGDPGGYRHRLRSRRAVGRRLEPAGLAACVPAHPGGRRRPRGDRDHRGGLHRHGARAGPGRSRCVLAAVWAVLQHVRVALGPWDLPGDRGGGVVVHARERRARHHRRRTPGPADPRTS